MVFQTKTRLPIEQKKKKNDKNHCSQYSFREKHVLKPDHRGGGVIFVDGFRASIAKIENLHDDVPNGLTY